METNMAGTTPTGRERNSRILASPAQAEG